MSCRKVFILPVRWRNHAERTWNISGLWMACMSPAIWFSDVSSSVFRNRSCTDCLHCLSEKSLPWKALLLTSYTLMLRHGEMTKACHFWLQIFDFNNIDSPVFVGWWWKVECCVLELRKVCWCAPSDRLPLDAIKLSNIACIVHGLVLLSYSLLMRRPLPESGSTVFRKTSQKKHLTL